MGKVKRFNGLPTKTINGPRRIVKTIVIEVECEDEDQGWEGNCLASGDDKVDRQQEKWIEHQLENGNPWAWCNIKVTATMDDATGRDTLGGCSYLSGADFCRPGGYFDDMVESAVSQMMERWSKRS